MIYWYCMGFQIELYQKENGKSPVLDSILETDAKMQAKIYREIDLLEQFGKDLSYPYIKKLEGKKYKDLWELRIKHSSNIFRIFYFIYINDRCILLHGFVKKTQKTPKQELETALSRMKDFLQKQEQESK